MTPDIGRCYLGYDPGGNGKHGVAAIRIQGDAVAEIESDTVDTASEVLKWFLCQNRIARLGPAVGIGVDTLTYWSGGNSGWRNADIHLRDTYRDVAGSVASANSLYGSMGLNGMFVLRRLRDRSPCLYVTETHPKVLHWALFCEPYAAYPGERPGDPPENATGEKRKEILSKIDEWQSAHNDWERMNPRLATVLRLDSKGLADFSKNPESGVVEDARMSAPSGVPGNDHEWDALISAWAAYRGHQCTKGGVGWEKNLVDGDLVDDEAKPHVDFPAGRVDYRWPSDEEATNVRERHRALIDR